VIRLIKRFYEKYPLPTILGLGLLFRLIAAVYSKGYAFTDDHYFVIEEAMSWLVRLNPNDNPWFPQVNTSERLAHGSLYTYLHYLWLSGYQKLGWTDPMKTMLSIRVIHACYSLSVIYLGFKITQILGNKKQALKVAWILSIAWFMPFLSVRNLVEMVCILPLLWMTYLSIKPTSRNSPHFWAGILASMAFAFRFQTILFTGAIGLVFLFQKEWKKALFTLVGFSIGTLLLLGFLDYQLFKVPFHEITSYITYNATHAHEYPNGPWYQYVLLLLGLFPLFLGGSFLTAIFFKGKKWLLLWVPFLVFLVFHSYFPNKQERFILPVVPVFIMIGVLSWDAILDSKNERWKAFDQLSVRLFAFLNLPLLLLLSVASTKTAKMDAMYRLSKQPNLHHFAIESTHKDYMEFMPQFYGNFWKPYQHILPQCNAECFFDSVSLGRHPFPNYILFFDTQQLQQRVKALKKVVPIEYVETIESSWLDQLVPKINPLVHHQTIQIWKTVTQRRLPAASSTSAIKSSAATKSSESP
jgi:hypothetical protein